MYRAVACCVVQWGWRSVPTHHEPTAVHFFRQFITDWRTVGAVAPTSSFARRAMLSPIDFSKVKVAVELGPGTGSITGEFLGRLRRDARLVAVEINEDFSQELKSRFRDPRLVVVNDSATELPGILRSLGHDGADCIVCSIPFANLGPDLRDAIVSSSYQGLCSDASLVALQYTPFVLPPLLKRHFGRHRLHFCMWNLPPALIYRATRA